MAPDRARREQPQARPRGAMQFIVTTSDPRKMEPQTRTLIRSHVMRGRNRKKRAPAKDWPRSESSRDGSARGDAPPKESALVIARKITSEISLFPFGDDMKPYMLESLVKYFNAFDRLMFALDRRLNLDPQDYFTSFSLAVDPAYLHTIIFTAISFFDWQAGIPPGGLAAHHFAKALRILVDRLAKAQTNSLATADSTMTCVLALAMVADVLGDMDEAAKHMRGIQQIAALRGGLLELRSNPILHVKITRADISLALNSGREPLFLDEYESRDIFRSAWKQCSGELGVAIDEEAAARPSSSIPPWIATLDPALGQIWDDLVVFTWAANLANRTSNKPGPLAFHVMMSSIHYRLLRVSFEPDSLDEAIRLSMLTFSFNVFLKLQAFKNHRGDLLARLRATYPGIDPAGRDMAGVVLWLLIVGAITMLDADDARWFQPKIVEASRLLGLNSWEEARAVLQGILWVDFAQDGEGQTAFEKAMASAETDRINPYDRPPSTAKRLT